MKDGKWRCRDGNDKLVHQWKNTYSIHLRLQANINEGTRENNDKEDTLRLQANINEGTRENNNKEDTIPTSKVASKHQ